MDTLSKVSTKRQQIAPGRSESMILRNRVH